MMKKWSLHEQIHGVNTKEKYHVGRNIPSINFARVEKIRADSI